MKGVFRMLAIIDQMNQADNQKIAELRDDQNRIRREFAEKANTHGLADLEPHIHAPHEEMVPSCRRVALGSDLSGVLIFVAWCYLQSTYPALSAFFGALLYFVLMFIADLGLQQAIHPVTFTRRFSVLFAPGAILLGVSAFVIAAGRFASPDVARVLANIEFYAWSGLELGSFATGVLAHLAVRRFGWSGRLHRQFQANEQEITRLQTMIEHRKSGSSAPKSPQDPPQDGPQGGGSPNPQPIRQPVRTGATGAILLAVALGGAIEANAQCPTILLDRTGSMVNQAKIERQLTENIGTNGAGQCVALIPFGQDVFGADRHVIQTPTLHPTLSGPVREAQRIAGAEEVRRQIIQILATPLVKANCTSVQDMLTRANSSGSSSKALLVSDADHDCPPVKSKKIGQGGNIIVVLGRSNRDRGNSAELFAHRRAAICKYLPGAWVMPEYELEQAVKLLFEGKTWSHGACGTCSEEPKCSAEAGKLAAR